MVKQVTHDSQDFQYPLRMTLILLDVVAHPQRMIVILCLLGSWTWYHKYVYVGELSNP